MNEITEIDKSFALLWSMLDSGQKTTLIENGYIIVISDRGIEWRIHHNGWMYSRVSKEASWRGWCAIWYYSMPVSIPVWDNMLAKKLILECSDRTMLSVSLRQLDFDMLTGSLFSHWWFFRRSDVLKIMDRCSLTM